MSDWYLNKSPLQILSKAPKNAKRPISSDLVTIKVEGKLEDGTKVDVFESLTFVLGDGDVIQGIRVKVFKNITFVINTFRFYWYYVHVESKIIFSKASFTYPHLQYVQLDSI